MSARQIAFIGRSGVGTTTIVANIAAALAEAGHRVAMIGCGASGYATASLLEGRAVPPVLPALRRTPQLELEQVAVAGFKGIWCMELGQAGEMAETAVALAAAAELLTSRSLGLDYVFYTVAVPNGDLVPYAAPLLRNRTLDQIIAVSTAEVAGLSVVNRMLWLADAFESDHRVDYGIIGNNLPAPYAEAIIDSFARVAGIPVVAFIPQSLVVTRSAFFGASVIDAAPLAHHAYLYRNAARYLGVLRPSSQLTTRTPLDEDQFAEWALDWGERLFEFGEGFVGTGGGI